MVLLCYPKCSTCQKAKRWLSDRHITYTERDIAANRPNEQELKEWQKKSGLKLNRFFNVAGLKYRALQLSERLGEMPDEQKIQLLASDGMLVRRPILVDEDVVLVGFDSTEWYEKLSAKK